MKKLRHDKTLLSTSHLILKLFNDDQVSPDFKFDVASAVTSMAIELQKAVIDETSHEHFKSLIIDILQNHNIDQSILLNMELGYKQCVKCRRQGIFIDGGETCPYCKFVH